MSLTAIKCTSCGAGLPDSLKCSYCGTRYTSGDLPMKPRVAFAQTAYEIMSELLSEKNLAPKAPYTAACRREYMSTIMSQTTTVWKPPFWRRLLA